MKKTITFLSLTFAMFLIYGKTQAQVDGTLDTSFDIGTGFDQQVRVIELQPDGNILTGGVFTSYNGTTHNRVARLNINGSIDTTFNAVTGNYNFIHCIIIAIQLDGKILVGGEYVDQSGITRGCVFRLNADGSFDTSFIIGADFSNSVQAIVLQPDGKILIGGSFMWYNGQSQNRIVRLNANGTFDASFNIGTGFSGLVNAIALQPDGKILVGGGFGSYNGQPKKRIARLNTDGTLDTSFDPGEGFNSSIHTINIQPDGKILVGGDFISYDGIVQKFISRLNTDGTLDTSFDIGEGFNGFIRAIDIQPDGKILAGGYFSEYNGQTQNQITRLNTDGTLDTSFTIGTGFNNIVSSISLQPDGKILVGGSFTLYNGQTTNRIVRLHNNNTMGIEDFENASVKIYPNPVKDLLYFSKEIRKITLTDLTGKVLSTQSNSSQIDMSGFQNGIYLITIETENGLKETKKVVKR